MHEEWRHHAMVSGWIHQSDVITYVGCSKQVTSCIIQVGRDKWVWTRKVLKPGNWYLRDMNFRHIFIFTGPSVHDILMKKKHWKCCKKNYQWSWMGRGGKKKLFSTWVIIFVVLRLPICLSHKAICLKNTIISSQRETLLASKNHKLIERCSGRLFLDSNFKWACWPFSALTLRINSVNPGLSEEVKKWIRRITWV